MITPLIEFDEEGHAYRLNGVGVPSVTEIMRVSGLMTYSATGNEDAMARGKEIHSLIESGDDHKVWPRYSGFGEQWFQACFAMRYERLECEKRVASVKYQYAGTLDHYAKVWRRRAVIDVKTGACPDWVQNQLGLYSLALREMGYIVDRLFCVVLKEDEHVVKSYDRDAAEAYGLQALRKARGE